GTAACGGGSGSSSKSSNPLSGKSSSSTKSADKNPSTDKSSSADEDSPADISLAEVDFCSLVDPAAATAIGLPAQGQAVDNVEGKSCYWAQDHTSMGIKNDISMLSGFSDKIVEKKFMGFSGNERYDENLNECDIAVMVGVGSALRISLGNPGDDNPALHGKGCAVGEDLMQHALAKIKK
ncbi:MAG: DUF3558 family protein, partial [Catenulispora sp.]|nr:DUF3558 family protein [Catenulispora sp.]